jgi:hypothetical protein
LMAAVVPSYRRCQLGETVCGWDDRRGDLGGGGAGLMAVVVPSYKGFRYRVSRTLKGA